MGRELELRLALEGKRKKRGLTSGSHGHPDKYLGDASRTVRRYLADCPRGGCYNVVEMYAQDRRARAQEVFLPFRRLCARRAVSPPRAPLPPRRRRARAAIKFQTPRRRFF